jgi:hypothetical protein
MRVIRSKTNPLVLKAFGTITQGSLGSFDTTLFEEIDLPNGLPENYTLLPREKTAPEVLAELRALFQGAPLSKQYQLREVMAEVVAASQGNNLPLMRYIIEHYVPAPEDVGIKTAMLAIMEPSS